MQDISREILIKASEGDIDSFEAVYRYASGFVYNVAFRIASNKQDAEEITQEVFIHIYYKLKDFRFESSFRTWVYRITVNCALNHSKRISREIDRIREYTKNFFHLGEPINHTSAGESSEYLRETVDLFLSKLDPKQRVCIILRDIEGLSYQEIAESLKININTVRTRLRRAREKLLNLKKEA